MWKNSSQVTEDLLSKSNEQQLPPALALFAAHKVLRGALLTKPFASNFSYAECLTLSKYGEEVFASIAEVTDNQPLAELKLAALRLFYHQEALLDFGASDPRAIQTLLTDDLLS